MAVPQISPSLLPSSLENYEFRTYYGLSGSGISSGESFFALDINTKNWFYYDDTQKIFVSSSDPINFATDEVKEIPDVEILAQNDAIRIFTNDISQLLFGTAISYGYSSIDDAISYYNSLDQQKREEARSFSGWRDGVEFLADQNIFSFTADGVTLPDLAGFTGQTGYAEFSVVPIPTTFFGDEDAGYHITDLENRIFTAWINVDNSVTSGISSGIEIPFPSSDIKNIYNITGLVNQGTLSSDWETEDYNIKIKMSGATNSYGSYTNFDYKLGSKSSNDYIGLKLHFSFMGSF